MKYQHRIPAKHHPKVVAQNVQGEKGDQYPKLKPLLKASSSIPVNPREEMSGFVLGYN